MDENTKKLVENQTKMVKKILELQELIKLHMEELGGVISGLEKAEGEIKILKKDVAGIGTALIGAKVLTEDGLNLHQSFPIESEEIKEDSEDAKKSDV